MIKATTVFLTKDVLRIVTCGERGMGPRMAHEPIFFLKVSDGILEIGKTALESLALFSTEIIYPETREDFVENGKKFEKNMQVKSWRGFVKISKNIDLEFDKENPDKIKITPMKNLIAAGIKREGDFKRLEEKTRHCDASDPEALGKAILEAFEDCE